MGHACGAMSTMLGCSPRALPQQSDVPALSRARDAQQAACRQTGEEGHSGLIEVAPLLLTSASGTQSGDVMFRALVTHPPAWTFSGTVVAGVLAACRAAARCARQFTCGLRGHQMLMRYRPDRLSLRCAWCGRESPGWEVGRGPMRVRSRAIPASKTNKKSGTATLRRVA